jgi:hypothetical protein
MIDEESLTNKIAHIILKVVLVFCISYFLITEYAFYWYLKDHYKTAMGIVVGKEIFENGGYVYRYEYVVEGVKYTHTGLPREYKSPPEIGKSYLVKYLEFMPSISGIEQ